ncbi:asparagine synthase (glutamine-hydrolyzing) [Curvivirga sp.]|uniref:asparagine synthase (glutamine-hydrolyzing) n=1 Tax=Curvivirga sp. TaxID=2856848 RepID=UPI003B5900C8
MCGITGYINFNGKPASEIIVRKMADMIRHRGPDDEGTFVDGNLALGHRRLSIVDLSSLGQQPMSDDTGRYTISYNGEIYNFSELRRELISLGVQFVSQTDTEVLLKGYVYWGKEILQKLNGMFAFAIWDASEQVLLLARDRYGVKPLYITRQNNWFGFGSEIKTFIAHPDYQKQPNLKGLMEYMTFQNFLSEQTLFKDVELLPAGSWMEVTSDGRCCQKQYWDYHFTEPENTLTTEEYTEQLSYLMEQAVNRQLMGDVPVNSYLSGGMDSGSITAIASKQLNEMQTFTVGFDLNSISGLEVAFDERNVAEFMSYKFRTEHYEMVLKAGDMERCLKKLVWHLEEPRVGQSYPNYYAAHLASKFGKVVLAGTGGDELFGGYPWRYYRAVVNDDFDHYVEKYYGFWQRLIPNKNIHEVFAPIADEVKDVWTRDIFRDVFKVHSEKLHTPEEYVNHSLYFEAKTFLQSLLVVEDKLSMAHGLESRVPFLDNDLVDFAMQVPAREKLGNLGEIVKLNENTPGPKSRKYFEKTNDGKLLLRKAMKNFIPTEVLEARKQGFSAPDESWFRGESIEYVNERLMTSNAKIYQYLDQGACRGLLLQHLEGTNNRRLLVWSLLYLEEWFEAFG